MSVQGHHCLHRKLARVGVTSDGGKEIRVPCHPESGPVLTALWGWRAVGVGAVGGPAVTLGSCTWDTFSRVWHFGAVFSGRLTDT